jgi:hypothetical protein
MLSSLESFYLATLRVIVLLAATLALIVVVVGFVRAAPLLVQQFNVAGVQLPAPGLAEFIGEKRGLAAPPAAASADAPKIDSALRDATGLIEDYAKKRLNQSVDPVGVAASLSATQSEFPLTYRKAYAASLKALLQQLNRSQGQPLSLEQVDELLDWHQAKFQASVEADSLERGANSAAALQAALVAGGALIAFLLIVCCFLFVKIERNLRPAQTNTPADPFSDPSNAPQRVRP